MNFRVCPPSRPARQFGGTCGHRRPSGAASVSARPMTSRHVISSDSLGRDHREVCPTRRSSCGRRPQRRSSRGHGVRTSSRDSCRPRDGADQPRARVRTDCHPQHRAGLRLPAKRWRERRSNPSAGSRMSSFLQPSNPTRSSRSPAGSAIFHPNMPRARASRVPGARARLGLELPTPEQDARAPFESTPRAARERSPLRDVSVGARARGGRSVAVRAGRAVARAAFGKHMARHWRSRSAAVGGLCRSALELVRGISPPASARCIGPTSHWTQVELVRCGASRAVDRGRPFPSRRPLESARMEADSTA